MTCCSFWSTEVGGRQGHGTRADTLLAPAERGREMLLMGLLLLMGLRLAQGIEVARFRARTGLAIEDALDGAMVSASIEAGYLERTPTHLRATAEGRLRLDALLAAIAR